MARNPLTPEQRLRNNELARERNKRWRAANRDYCLSYSRNHYEDIREREAEKRRSPEFLAKARYRNADRRGLISTIDEMEPGAWGRVLAKHGDKCLKCGGGPVTQDHVVPLSKGGRHHESNLQPLCGPCNAGKRDTEEDYRSGS